MMFGRLLTPDTVDYMIAGYVVVTLAIGIYLASMALRWKRTEEAYRNLKEKVNRE